MLNPLDSLIVQPYSEKSMNQVNENVLQIISKLDKCLSNRAAAQEVFGSASFGRKGLDGKTLKTLAMQYKAAYQNWLDVLNTITDDVCDAWDAHLKQKEAEEYFKSLTDEQKAALGFQLA